MSYSTPLIDTSPNASSGVCYITVDEYQAGQRIDNFLLKHLKGVPKSHIYRILRKGEVRVNKKRIKPTYRVEEGDAVRVPPTQHRISDAPPQASQRSLDSLSSAIVYQDKSLLIINKPSGLAVHGGSGIRLGVIEQLRQLYPTHEYLELVHRIDRDTSGCLMVARKPAMLRELQQLLRGSRIQKHYLALVQGQWPERRQYVDAKLKKNQLSTGGCYVRVEEDGKAARSGFHIKQVFNCATLMDVKPISGRTHQIRVHAQYAGHPLAGDDKYGNETFNVQLKRHGLKRLFLHAHALSIPFSEREPLQIKIPLPDELQQVLDNLR